MKDGPILALDLATATGWAYGAPGSVPRSGTIRFASPGATCGEVGCGLMRWLSDFLAVCLVSKVYFEAPFDPRHMGNKTNFNTTRILVGIPFLLETLLDAKGIMHVREVTVGDVRKHFLGKDRRGDEGKTQVQAKCRTLGWDFDSADAADALAVWSFACAVEAPAVATATSPLFQSAFAAPSPRVRPSFGYDDIEDIPA